MMKFIFPAIHFNIERWKWNEECQVYVSNLGNIKDENKKLLRIHTCKNGYVKVRVNDGKKLKNIHRLVMETWKPCEDMDKLTIDHLNHNKRENTLKNLEWVTEEENLRRAKVDALIAKDIIPDEITNDMIIVRGKKKYANINLAIADVMSTTGSTATASTADVIRNKIIFAIKEQKKYCGVMWKAQTY